MIARPARVAAAVLALILLLEHPALAYLDPGSGSMILQVLLGGAAAVVILGRVLWRRVTAQVSGLLGRRPAEVSDKNETGSG